MTDQFGAASGSSASMNHQASSFPVAGGTTTFDINRNMTDSQFRQTWNQISSAANSIAAAPSAYASPAPQLPQNKVYMKNVQTWSSTSTPAPNKQGISSSRPSRTRSTRTGNSTPAPSTPVQVPVQAATPYVQPMYHQQAVASAPVPQYQQAQYVAPTYVLPQPIAPIPVAAAYIPPISNPPKAPIPPRPQALETTYSSRMKTGTSLLMQPILQTTTQTLLGTRSTRRGAVINYADPGSGDDLPDAGELDSGDSDFAASGGTRQSLRQQGAAGAGSGRSGASGVGMFNAQTGVGSGYASPAPQVLSDQIDQSYLGMVPPARFIKPRLMVPTPHEYPSADIVAAQAQKRTSLVPIRVEFETETLRIRDCFVWNLNESSIKPESFARIFCNDMDLPLNPWAETIAAQIRAQLEEYQDVAAMELGMDGAVDFNEMGESTDELPECRVVLSIDVQIANHHLMDHIEWDLLSPLTPEHFARQLCAELSLTGEAVPLIAHAVHEELVKHKKDVIEWGVLGSTSSTTTDAVQLQQQAESSSTPAPGAGEPEKRDRSGYSLLKDKTGLGLGWGRAPRDGRGPKTLRSVWRDWAEAEEFGTSFEALTAEDIEKREIERERASRRLRRETSKFQSAATGRMRNLRYR